MSYKSVYYDSTKIYINSASNIKEKIAKLDLVINALLDVALKAAETDNIQEYSLDSGQTKIKTNYNGADEVYNAIKNYEKMRTYYVNKLNGRSFILRDKNNFRR